MKLVFLIAACCSVLAVALICIFLFMNGVPAIFKIGPLKFLTGTVWKPGNNIFGILPMIIGSIYVTAAHMTGIAANQPEKKEKTKPIYRFFLKLPHQSMILFTVPNMSLHLLSDFPLPSVLLPHEPATFADKADNSEATLPGFPPLLYSHFLKQRFCLNL